jgi:hypothetical protein
VLGTQQRANLARLADYLAALPADYEHFSMENFLEFPLPPRQQRALECEYALGRWSMTGTRCGTAACALGHGPAAGVLFRESEICWPEQASPGQPGVPDWLLYSRRFCPDSDTDPAGRVLWRWLFGGEWMHCDDTPRGAAARIRYVLADQPVPDVAHSLGFYDEHYTDEEEPEIFSAVTALYAPYLPPCPPLHPEETTSASA